RSGFRTLHNQSHARFRSQRVVVVLNLPHHFSCRRKAIDRENQVAWFQSFCFCIAAGFDSNDITLVSNGLHLPAIFHPRHSSWWNEEEMRIVKVQQGLSDNAEYLTV